MGRKNKEFLPAVTRNKLRKVRKRQYENGFVEAENKFNNLADEEQPESTHNDIILVDSSEDDTQSNGKASSNSNTNGAADNGADYDDDDEVVVVSDSEDQKPTEQSNTNEQPPAKKRKLSNDLAGGSDFIGFGFESSESEHDDDANYSDDGILSDDHSGAKHSNAQSTSDFAWVKGHDHSKQKEIADWLTLEIKDFVNYISPSKDEIVTRNAVINKLKKNINQFWPKTQAHVFGSCATDLYLPGSDIDMVVISTTGDYESRQRLYSLASYLRKNKLAKNIEVIATAKVPIIKFVDPEHNISIDISFERTNGLDAARRIRRWLDSTPGLRELALIIKQFLRSRKLNNVHVGGLGGYSTIILVYHFLKLHPRVSTGNIAVMENLGTLLIEFFELYGRNFSYDNLIISIDSNSDSPKYLKKTANPVLTNGRGQFSIVIQDPSDPANNISRSSYNLRDLKKAFGGAYQLLVDKCYELNSASYKARLGQLILGDIIKFRGKDRDFNDDRDKVINNALIDNDDEPESESDGGFGNNDKYYFSDMTVESEEEQEPPHKKAKTDSRKAEDFLSIKDDDTEDLEKGKLDSESSKANLDVNLKRDYWKLKGLETSL